MANEADSDDIRGGVAENSRGATRAGAKSRTSVEGSGLLATAGSEVSSDRGAGDCGIIEER